MELKLKLHNYISTKMGGLTLIQWVIATLFCIPIVISTRYTVFWTDDFSHYCRLHNSFGEWGLVSSINYMKEVYLTWQGTYFSMFIQALLSPMDIGGLKALRFISVTNSFFLFISFYFFLRYLMEYLEIDKKNAITFFLLIIVPLFTYKSYSEILYWFSGQTSYSFPMSMGFISCSFFLKSKISKKKKTSNIWLISALIFAIITVGGSLEIAAFFCYLVTLIGINEYIRDNKIIKSFIIYYLVIILGSFINGIAPGNYLRHSAVDAEGFSIFENLYYSIVLTIDQIEFYFLNKNTTLLVFGIMAFLVGYKTKVSIKNEKTYIVNALLIAIMPIVCVFPVVMGYSYSIESSFFPNRVQFAFDFAFISAFVFIAFLIGNIICNKFFIKNHKLLQVILIFYSLSFIINNGKPLNEYIPCIVLQSIVDGSLVESADEIINAYNEVEDSTEVNVAVIYPNEAPTWFAVHPLSDSPSDWTNGSIAQYYGKESVAFYRE